MRRFFKRLTDILAALIAFVLFGPLILAIGILIWVTMGRPILFKQVRAGYLGRPFTLCKFRTMRDARDAQGRLLEDSARLTRTGIFLRQFSLDELPQLWNVLIGDMSLVGPRPLLVEYLSRYSLEQARRHNVRPGVTGWAQVNGRNALTWEQKFEHDVWYVDHWDLRLDIRICLMTIAKAMRGEGVFQNGYATAEEFRGAADK